MFRRRSQKTSKLRVTGLCAENSSVTGEFPTQKAGDAENVSIWWRHHAMSQRGVYIIPILYTMSNRVKMLRFVFKRDVSFLIPHPTRRTEIMCMISESTFDKCSFMLPSYTFKSCGVCNARVHMIAPCDESERFKVALVRHSGKEPFWKNFTFLNHFWWSIILTHEELRMASSLQFTNDTQCQILIHNNKRSTHVQKMPICHLQFESSPYNLWESCSIIISRITRMLT